MFTEDDMDRADWAFLRDGAVSLFWKTDVLEGAKDDLGRLGYEIAELVCLDGGQSFETQLSEVLRWKKQFGYTPWSGNFNALREGFEGYPFSTTGRSVLILKGFHRLVALDSDLAQGVLNVIEYEARNHLLFGKVLICLVQTDDNRYSCDSIGSRSANWNAQEWFHADRGL